MPTTFSPTEWIAIISTIGVVIVNVIVALRTNAAVAEVSAKADVITGHVNSAATASNMKIAALEGRVADLTRQLASGDLRAAVLAQSASDTAVAAATVATVPASPSPGHEPV